MMPYIMCCIRLPKRLQLEIRVLMLLRVEWVREFGFLRTGRLGCMLYVLLGYGDDYMWLVSHRFLLG
jgi:hypothetical protein